MLSERTQRLSLVTPSRHPPDAQYVAQNPEAAAEPTQQQMYSRQQYEGETESGRKAVDDLTSNETPQTPIETLNEVTDILPKGKIGKATAYS